MGGDVLAVPIGHDLGAFHPDAGFAAHVRQIRVGADVVELDDADFARWRQAHDPDGPVGGAEGLLRAGVLAEVAPGDAVGFATGHRLLPLVLGLGNTAEQPWLYSVGLLHQPLVVMSGPLYDVWQWAHLSPDLWSACLESVRVASEAGATDPDRIDPELVLAGVLGALHRMLSAGVACVDVRIEVDR
ncbi:hypothetical protein ALI22I_01440 [Saccharothrix sp. ALI-22-I]|uniref:hypothetical protein n=1 Tax=Saccharothrix sp. ALI-22-I TaxID=1933778 RepID=UPI00097C4CF1|nr:hypothetical protein [Saccharothrix sp. ALI-22-I]ONI92868.1 hypothetical protein ALI22I_01440 [Saccharothrix sp. ALI-22-I]